VAKLRGMEDYVERNGWLSLEGWVSKLKRDEWLSLHG
jgi:hypothetical protein